MLRDWTNESKAKRVGGSVVSTVLSLRRIYRSNKGSRRKEYTLTYKIKYRERCWSRGNHLQYFLVITICNDSWLWCLHWCRLLPPWPFWSARRSLESEVVLVDYESWVQSPCSNFSTIFSLSGIKYSVKQDIRSKNPLVYLSTINSGLHTESIYGKPYIHRYRIILE